MKKGIKPKNRVFCPVIERSKKLFDTKERAEMYIKRNAETIRKNSGVAPVRAYYCKACGGWHVTHKLTNSGREDEIIEKLINSNGKWSTKKAAKPEPTKKPTDKEVAEEYFLKHYKQFSSKREFKQFLKENPDNLTQLSLEWVRHLVKELGPEVYTMDIDLSQNHDKEANALLQEIPQNILFDRDLLDHYIKWEIQYKQKVNPGTVYSLREKLRKENKL